jgi:hypothetical protein
LTGPLVEDEERRIVADERALDVGDEAPLDGIHRLPRAARSS